MDPELRRHLERTRDPDPVERGRAAEALGAHGGEAAVEALAGLLEDSDVIVRFKASRELACLGDARGVAVLTWALGRKELCFIALDAFIELGSPDGRDDVRRFFKRWHLHPLERMQAAAALFRCGDEEGLRFLETCLGSERPEERGYALELWGRLKMPDALDRLQAVLADDSDPHRLDAARGLGHLGDPRGLPVLERLARQHDDPELAEVAGVAAAGIREREK